jgi:spermidine synthase
MSNQHLHNRFSSGEQSGEGSAPALILALVFVLSVCSISYELILARLFSELSDREIVWHSATIAIYVAALGFGTLISERILKRRPGLTETWRLLFKVELLLVIIGCTSVYAIWFFHSFVRIEALSTLIIILTGMPFQIVDVTIFFGQILCFSIGILSGFEIPLLAHILAGQRRAKGDPHTQVLGVNYMGTLGGTLLFLFLLTPSMDLGYASWCVALLNLASVFVIALITGASHKQLIATAMGITVAAWTGLGMDGAHQASLKGTYYINLLAAFKADFVTPLRRDIMAFNDVLTKQSPYQTIHLVRSPQVPTAPHTLLPGVPFTLYIDRHFQMSSEHEALYHEFFVHYPIALFGRVPERVLLLGAGDGLAARELLRYPNVQSITQIEIDPMMIDLARNHPAFKTLNQSSMHDPRVHLIQDDAFTFLKRHRMDYDAVFIDFPYPFSFELSRLYSQEFYTFVRRNLRNDGFAVLDLPLIAKNNKSQTARIINDIFASTLSAAGFPVLSAFGGEGATSYDLETFMIALPKRMTGPAPEIKQPTIPFRYLYTPKIRHYQNRDFEFHIKDELAHSVFKPTLFKVRDVML